MSKTANTKKQILRAARQLLLEVGYESMSPAMVLERSGAGKGSLYHHFSGKKDLALRVLDDVSDELKEETARLLRNQALPPAARLEAYLTRPRNALKGCKLGRLSNEKALCNKQLREPVESYFRFALDELKNVLAEGVEDGSFPADTPVDEIAHLLAACIQGGYVLSKSTSQPERLAMASNGALALLNAYRGKQTGKQERA